MTSAQSLPLPPSVSPQRPGHASLQERPLSAPPAGQDPDASSSKPHTLPPYRPRPAGSRPGREVRRASQADFGQSEARPTPRTSLPQSEGPQRPRSAPPLPSERTSTAQGASPIMSQEPTALASIRPLQASPKAAATTAGHGHMENTTPQLSGPSDDTGLSGGGSTRPATLTSASPDARASAPLSVSPHVRQASTVVVGVGSTVAQPQETAPGSGLLAHEEGSIPTTELIPVPP